MKLRYILEAVIALAAFLVIMYGIYMIGLAVVENPHAPHH